MIKEKYQNYTLLKASVDFHRHNEIKGLAQDSMKTYRGYVSKFIEWRGNDTLVSDITTDLLEENAEYKMECGNKAVSMETNIRHLRCFLRFCEKRGMANRIDITIPKYEKELKEPYTDEEMALLLIRPRSDSWTEYRKPERRTD